jgi:hypothetical protein
MSASLCDWAAGGISVSHQQAPNPRHQTTNKHRISSFQRLKFGFGVWNLFGIFFGTWDLIFGIWLEWRWKKWRQL